MLVGAAVLGVDSNKYGDDSAKRGGQVAGFGALHFIGLGDVQHSCDDSKGYNANFGRLLQLEFEAVNLPFDGVHCVDTNSHQNADEAQMAAVRDIVMAEEASEESPVLIISSHDPKHWNSTLSAGPKYVHFFVSHQPPDPSHYGRAHDSMAAATFLPDNFLGGKMVARNFCKRAKRAPRKIVVLHVPDDSISAQRVGGFKEGILEMCPHHVIHQELPIPEWDRLTAKAKVSAMFLADQTVDALVCVSDILALGAIAGAKQARPSGVLGLLITGYGDMHEIEQDLREGHLIVTIDDRDGIPFAMSHLASELRTRLTGEYLNVTNVDIMDILQKNQTIVNAQVKPVVSNEQEYLLGKLLQDYDPGRRPLPPVSLREKLSDDYHAKPTPVQMSITLQKMQVDSTKQLVVLNGYLKLWWDDSRLAFAPFVPKSCASCLEPIIMQDLTTNPIWVPDVYFKDAVDSEEIFASGAGAQETKVEIMNNGSTSWSRHARLVLNCPMDFTNFPFDRQLCKVWTGLYSLDETQITMGWRPGVEPIINWRMDLAEWEVSYVKGSKKVMDFEGFNHSYALAVIDLQRKPNYYVKYVITPNALFVLLSYSTFYISRAVAPARVGMTITLMLVIIAQQNSQLSQVPKASKSVWLLEYLSFTIYFVFFALVEYIMCNFIGRAKVRIDRARAKALQRRRDVEAAGGAAAPGDVKLVAPKGESAAGSSTRPSDSQWTFPETTIQDRTGQMKMRQVATALIAVVNPNVAKKDVASQTLQQEVRALCGRFDSRMVNKAGYPYFRDQDLDIICRFLYLPIYLVIILVHCSQIW